MISSRLFVISITDIHPMTQSRSCFTFALSILFLFSVSSGSSVVPSEFIDLSEPVLACLLFSFIYLYGIPASFSGLPPSVFALPSTPSFRFSFFILCLLSPAGYPIISWCPSSAILCVTIYHAFFHMGLTCIGGQ